MGRRARELTPQASVRDRFGAELRRWRTTRGLTQSALGELVWHSAEVVAKVEKAERWPTQYFAERCDLVLGAGGVLIELFPLVEVQRLACDGRRVRSSSGEGRVPSVERVGDLAEVA